MSQPLCTSEKHALGHVTAWHGQSMDVTASTALLRLVQIDTGVVFSVCRVPMTAFGCVTPSGLISVS